VHSSTAGSNVLPDSELARMRVDLEAILPGTAVVYQGGTVSDGHGGWVDSWSAIGTVPANAWPIDQREERYAERLQGRQGFILSVPDEQVLSESMRVTFDGMDLQVVGVEEWGPWRIHRRAVVVRIG
jgi:head-tail adaptor